jgi:hypothetical protein
MEILGTIIGAIISWAIPKMLDALLDKSKRELQEGFPWVRWCLGHGIGGGVGGFLSGTLGLLGLETPGGLGNWTVFGVAIGICQWAVLRRYLEIGPPWAVFSAVGWSSWSFFQAAQLSPYLGWSAVGLGVGVLQWLILVRVRRGAFWWVPTNTLGWLVGGSLGWVVGQLLLRAGGFLPVCLDPGLGLCGTGWFYRSRCRPVKDASQGSAH